MNLYTISPDPKECAKYLDNKRLGWTGIKESAQLISTALKVLYDVDTPIKPTHENHPVSRWVRGDISNLLWTIDYMLQCGYEYKRRFGKDYHVKNLTPGNLYINFRTCICDKAGIHHKYKPQTFCNCACRLDKGIDYRHIENTHDAYRMYLAHRWYLEAQTNRPPKWR